jgi:hypothetical protein
MFINDKQTFDPVQMPHGAGRRVARGRIIQRSSRIFHRDGGRLSGGSASRLVNN